MLFGWANPGFENFTEDHFRQVKLLFNGVYYFEYNNFLPYVTAGAGAYFVRQTFENAPDPDSETRGGLNFGVGTEYVLGEGASVKGELRWDIVSQPTGFPDATGVSLTFGYKRYLLSRSFGSGRSNRSGRSIVQDVEPSQNDPNDQRSDRAIQSPSDRTARDAAARPAAARYRGRVTASDP